MKHAHTTTRRLTKIAGLTLSLGWGDRRKMGVSEDGVYQWQSDWGKLMMKWKKMWIYSEIAYLANQDFGVPEFTKEMENRLQTTINIKLQYRIPTIG